MGFWKQIANYDVVAFSAINVSYLGRQHSRNYKGGRVAALS